MFNRGTQWATEAELEGDLQALPGLTATVVRPAPPADLRAPLQAAELTLGSFFFVHRARATRDGIALETYEFLHATFGEFLVARLIHGVVRNLSALEQASAFPSGEAVDDDLLHALLSFAPLAGRRQTVDFLRGIVSAMPPAMRTEWTDLLVRLFRPAMSPRPPRAFGDYLPRHRSLSVYSANLLLLALCADDIRVSRLFGGDDTHNVEAWRDMCLRWRSESAAGGWLGMLDLIRVDRVRRAGRIDVSLSLGSPDEPPPVDLSWLLRMDSDGDARVWVLPDPIGRLRQEAHFTCDFEADILQHVLDPLVAAGLKEAGAEVRDSAGGFASALNVLMRLGVAESMAAANRMALYREALAWHDRHPAIVLAARPAYDRRRRPSRLGRRDPG